MHCNTSGGFAALFLHSSKRSLWATLLLVLSMALFVSHAHAQTSTSAVPNPFSSTSGSSEQGTALVTASTNVLSIVYKILDVVAILLGCLGVWRLLEHDYKWAVGFVVCAAFLYGLPAIVQTMKNIGTTADSTAQSSGSS